VDGSYTGVARAIGIMHLDGGRQYSKSSFDKRITEATSDEFVATFTRKTTAIMPRIYTLYYSDGCATLQRKKGRERMALRISESILTAQWWKVACHEFWRPSYQRIYARVCLFYLR
jgi:hypothetical protein